MLYNVDGVSTGGSVTTGGSEICSGGILTIKEAEPVIRPCCLEFLVGFDLKIQDGSVGVFHADAPSLHGRDPGGDLFDAPYLARTLFVLLPNSLHCCPMLYIFWLTDNVTSSLHPGFSLGSRCWSR